MIVSDSGIEFDFPTDWEHFTEGKRWVFHSPEREEVIVSLHSVTGTGGERQFATALEKVFQNGLLAVQRAAADPQLRVTRPLAEDRESCRLPCWTIVAETMDRDVLFAQAVIRHSHGTVLLTYESPFLAGAEQSFRSLLGMICDRSAQRVAGDYRLEDNAKSHR